MRIPIREQLGLLILLTSLIALAVVAIATVTDRLPQPSFSLKHIEANRFVYSGSIITTLFWVSGRFFSALCDQSLRDPDGPRSSGLSLTASLKAAQLSSNLLLLQSSVHSIATRVLLQTALQRYDAGNNTDANWSRSEADLQGALAGGGGSALLLQATVYSKNGTGVGDPFGLLNVTGIGVQGMIPLPYNHSNGSSVYLGDDGLGYPPELYPNFTYTSTPVNDTYNTSTAYLNGSPVSLTSMILFGPWQVNASFAMLSLTVPIINNTSLTDILGYITVLMDARLVYDVVNSYEGLDNTGSVLLIGPSSPDNKFAEDGSRAEMDVRFLLPPSQNPSRGIRHSTRAFGQQNTPFPMKSYPAVLDAYTERNLAVNNADSLISTKNEEGETVSVGYAIPNSVLCDWALLVEFTHGEVVAPINRLRNVLIACVFGTTAAIMLLVFPIAHFSVRPIRRLRAATRKTVRPVGSTADDDSLRSLDSREEVSGDEENLAREAKKEGFIGKLSGWRRGQRKSRSRQADDTRRQTFRIPGKVEDRKHFIHDELTDLTKTYNEMSEELMMQYAWLEERVQERTQELEVSKKAAEAANESKTLFIANISHGNLPGCHRSRNFMLISCRIENSVEWHPWYVCRMHERRRSDSNQAVVRHNIQIW